MTTERKAKYQHTFDTVSKHLLTQNKHCRPDATKGASYKCAYRLGDGTRCAIGCLIPDEFHLDNYENTLPIMSIMCGRTDIRDYLAENFIDNSRFLECLQEIHDSHDPKDWPMRLTRLASDYELDNSVMKGHIDKTLVKDGKRSKNAPKF